MKTKMFGHRGKKSSGRVPGQPFNDAGESDESSYKYVKGKDFSAVRGMAEGKSKDNPSGAYEGKEHMKYKDPGYSSHHIKFPEDEPHMGRSSVSKNEMHEMEDNYHHDVPDQTHYDLAAKIKRARMKMDAPDQEEPDRLRGNMVTTNGSEGVEDTSGKEEMGPNDMQSGMSKEHRKKMIVAVTRRKMGKNKN